MLELQVNLRVLPILKLGVQLLDIHFVEFEICIFLYLKVVLQVEGEELHECVAFEKVLIQWLLVHKQRRLVLAGESFAGLFTQLAIFTLHFLQLLGFALALRK